MSIDEIMGRMASDVSDQLWVPVTYFPLDGPAIDIRAGRNEATAELQILDVGVRADSLRLKVLKADIDTPAEGDRVLYRNRTYQVDGAPKLNGAATIWELDLNLEESAP